MASLVKHSGQVFTPEYLVRLILDEAGYNGPGILRKHCIDNSCGDGAFLLEIVRRYSSEYVRLHKSSEGLSDELATFIHGIELDKSAFSCCLENLKNLSAKLSLPDTKFHILNQNALSTSSFDGKMDFVVGNPPYVRVHNLDNFYSDVKKFSFASDGMTDLYLVFFELGFRMLKDGGRLCYITPSSWLNSLAGNNLRNYIRHTRSLVSLIDLAHFQAFKATTYTLISLFVKGRENDSLTYYSFDKTTLSKTFEAVLSITDIDIKGAFYLADNETLHRLKTICDARVPQYVTVKNGFATLADKIFISNQFPFDRFLIPVIKASTGRWYQAFFPYDRHGRPLDKALIFSHPEVARYLESNKGGLLKNDSEAENPFWFLFGRTQALKDVFSDKLAVNTTIKDIDSLKINLTPAGSGIYSGLYILSDIDLEAVTSILKTTDFIKYIASLKKYKSGGYYTFNSKDLESYLNYHIHQLQMEPYNLHKTTNEDFLAKLTESFVAYLCKGTSRSTDKLKAIHGTIAYDIKRRLGPDYEVCSQGYGNDKEDSIQGRYISKKVDITVKHQSKPVAGIAVKFVMRNYSQNSNNYFENMLGETANIRCNNYPYFQIFIILDPLPYYKKNNTISKWEKFSDHNISKYITLSYYNTESYFHTPNKTLICVLNHPQRGDFEIKNHEDYIKYYQANRPKLTFSAHDQIKFGPNVILNDYESFMDKVYHTIMAV